MTQQITAATAPFFTDQNGKALDLGFVWVGAENQDPQQNPVAVFWDESLTVAASQPLRTANGYIYRNGAPATVYHGATSGVSMRVSDRNQRIIANTPSAGSIDGINLSGYLDSARPMQSYTALRAYTGCATSVRITTTGIAGHFRRNGSAADNGGTVIVDGSGRSWERVDATPVDVVWFGAAPNTAADSTAALQAAINTGKTVVIPEGEYWASGLTGSTAGQVISASGKVKIKKNTNGPIITHSGNYIELNGIEFEGAVYTGHNIVATGNHPRLINCASKNAELRALLATGSHVQIIGTNDAYTTRDTSATGYDIEIGVSGTATLYHQLTGVYTSQSTGGVLLVDTGSHVLAGGQLGKLTIKAATPVLSGTNGGMTSNVRILGDVKVERSNATFTANQFGVVNVVFAAGTSGCRLDTSNTLSVGTTVTNYGNANNFIAREVSTGSVTQIKYGDDSSTAVMEVTTNNSDDQFAFSGAITLPNGKGLKSDDSSGTPINIANGTNGNVASFASKLWSRTDVSGAFINLNTTAGSQVQVVDGALRPFSDNTKTLGTSSLRWSTVYAGTGTINTSDERQKQQFAKLSDAEKRVAKKAKLLLKSFKFSDAVELKGDNARIHFGLSAQALKAAFESEGLVAEDYAVLCYDEWPDAPAVVSDDGTVIQDSAVGGNRYGVRYDELFAFIVGAL